MGQPAFDSTAWSVIAAAQGDNSGAAREALALLCERYWLPLYAYIRRQGRQREEAEDLTQEFFAHLIAHGLVQQADRDRGRFRTFLLACLDHFLLNEWQHRQAAKRGAGVTFLPLDFETGEARYALEARHGDDPQRAFDRLWAQTLMEAVAGRLEAEYARAGNLELFKALQGSLGRGEQEMAYGPTSVQLGLSEGAVRVAVHRLRKRFAALAREEIGRTVADTEAVREELRYLIRALVE